MREIYTPFIIIIAALTMLAAVLTLGQAYGYCSRTEQPFPPFSIPLSDAAGTGTFEISGKGFVPANITLVGTYVSLRSGCYEIGFDVTNDQAYSIRYGIDDATTVRPLTHDVLRDIIEGFNITMLSVRVEKFENDIYYARMFARQGSRIIDMDMRPSDAIALSLRTRDTLHINETMLREKGTNVC